MKGRGQGHRVAWRRCEESGGTGVDENSGGSGGGLRRWEEGGLGAVVGCMNKGGYGR